MKDAEDEAFDDLAKKQGDWGGGFKAKQAMAADKLQEPAHCQCEACINGNIHDSDCSVHNDGDALPVGPCDCSRATPHLPAQEPDALTIAYQAGFYDGKKAAQRPWVGLTDDELADLWYKESLDWMEFARAHEAALKEKNS
jgi:hypothetical protein